MCLITQSCPNFCDPMAHWLLCPQIFPGMNTGIGSHFLLQGIFLTQGSIKLQSLAVPALASGFFPLNCMGRPGNFLKQLPSPNCYIVPFNDIENLGIFHILFQWAFISFRWQRPQHCFIFCVFCFFFCLFVCLFHCQILFLNQGLNPHPWQWKHYGFKKYSKPKNWKLCFIQWEFLGLHTQKTAFQVTLRELFWESEGRSQFI